MRAKDEPIKNDVVSFENFEACRRAIRTRRDMTIRKLARQAQLSPETIDHLELGRGEIDLLQIARISAVLKVGCGKILHDKTNSV